jgi:lysophospholipase L1-like esterase
MSLVGALLLVPTSLSFAADKIRVACVGDSITFGAGVEKREVNNYPKVLGSLLGDKYEVRNFGVSGATLLSKGDHPYIKTGAYSDAKKFAPQIVIIKLGTNDTKPQNWKHEADFLADATNMIKEF